METNFLNGKIDFEQEVKQANELAQNVTINQVPLLIMSAMAGIVPKSTNNRNMQMAEPSDDIKGLIFTKDDLVNIIRYVDYGLKLPQNDKEINAMMPYTEKDNQCLNTEFYKTFFERIRRHCQQWDSLQKGTILLGTDLKIFADKFCEQGKAIISVITAMPVYQQACKTVGDVTIEFSSEDFELKGALKDILDAMKTDISSHQNNVKNLSEKLLSFKNELNRNILPSASNLEQAISNIDLSEKKTELQNKKAQLENEIDTLQKTYNKLVGYAFTGTTGLVFGPIGIISWAITGGVFGQKAEDTRKELNNLKKQLDSVIQEISQYSIMDKSVLNMKNTINNIALSIENAIVGVAHLDILWETIGQYIDSAQKQLDSVTDSKRLIVFKTDMESCILSWSQVKDITADLVKLFDEALNEIYKRTN